MHQVFTHEIYDFEQLPNPLEVGEQPCGRFDKYNLIKHEIVGDLQYKNFILPYMHISHMYWNSKADVHLVNKIPSTAINFLFFLEGNGLIQNTELDQVFYPQKGRHYLSFTPEGGFYNELGGNLQLEVFMISLDLQFFKSLLNDTSEWSQNLWIHLENSTPLMNASTSLGISPAMWQIIQDLKSYQQTGIIQNLTIQSQVLELISLQIEILQNSQESNSDLKAEDVAKLQELKNFLDENYLENFSLFELSRLCFLNEFKLKKGFKQLFGTTVFGYIRKLKMEHAARLLSQSVPIAQVAYELGYEYPHHFSVAFKNYMGVNPSFFHSKTS